MSTFFVLNYRVRRKEILEKSRFGSEQYALEELTAECGTSYLKSISSLEESGGDNSTANIQHWLTILKKIRG